MMKMKLDKKISKKNIFAFLLGGTVVGSTTIVASTIYNSDQISYNPDNTNFDAANVKQALDKLYDYAMESSVYYLGTGTTFDIKQLYPNIDYTKLDDNSFIIGSNSFSKQFSGTASGTCNARCSYYCWGSFWDSCSGSSTASVPYSVNATGGIQSHSYNSTTGILTINADGCTPFAYLVLGGIENN